ncbi:ATP-binding protein [Paraburkholderia sp. Tr-20389]|nr:ATP-binding protein [Paraburkholderia sp. Tr-20389]
MCMAPELKPEFAALYASLQGDEQLTRPTFGMALAFLPHAYWNAIAPNGALRRWRIIELDNTARVASAGMRLDERILHYLLGIDDIDERIAHLVSILPIATAQRLPPSHVLTLSQIVALWRTAGTLDTAPVVQLCGDPDDYLPIVSAAAAVQGVRAALTGADRVPSNGMELDAFVRLWDREVVLDMGGVLIVERNDMTAASEQRNAISPHVAYLLGHARGRIVVAGRERVHVQGQITVTFDVHHPDSAEQRLAWKAALSRPPAPGTQADAADAATDERPADATAEPMPSAEANTGEAVGPLTASAASGAQAAAQTSPPELPPDDTLDALAFQFDLSLNGIRTIAAQAVAGAGSGRAAAEAAWDLCRLYLRDRMDGLAHRLESRVDWCNLVLPDDQLNILRTIAAQVGQRRTVYERWGFGARGTQGLGISVLFHGVSGTGKTLAAQVLANVLRLDLYRIDLSSVVSKYIGETEKELRRVFDAAEDSGAILLFDEADALFGARSTVRDSHDRYANIEVSYLLQRMEAYRGLAILTTNQKQALDSAFMRRLRFVVQFPFPDAAQRVAIWRDVFPSSAPIGQLDLARLGGMKLAGGNIRNIAMNAAFLAAHAGEAIGMDHVLSAARAEYAKLERPLTIAETGMP